MKKYNNFLEEITIKGSPGIPGEGEKKDNESPYLSDVERRAKQRLNIRPQDTQRVQTPQGSMPSRKEMELGMRLMDLLKQSMRFISGKEEELTELANSVFISHYGDLVEKYEIELDIKIVKPGKVKEFMDECEECEDEEPPKFKKVEDEETKLEIHKRKMANLVIQGEAKNTKHILHSSEVKDGLEEIYGDRSTQIFDIWDEMTKIADKLDWIIPAEIRADMMEQMPDFMAGACFVDWKKKDEDEEEEEKPEKEYKEPEPEEPSDEEYEEDQTPMERFDETPIIRARGVDFPMLLHESVKGLYEFLSLGGIPEDKKVAEIALLNTGLSDEPEDWKYGPEIASDIRDFVNKNDKVVKYPNVREELFKLMIDKETMPTKEFLSLMRGILSGTKEARIEVDRLIDKVITGSEEFIQYKKDMDKYNLEMDEYNAQMKEYNKSKGSKEDKKEEPNEIEKIIKSNEIKPTDSIDYSKMNKRQLEDALNDAIDDNDKKALAEISKVLQTKESFMYKIYESEITRILKSRQ